MTGVQTCALRSREHVGARNGQAHEREIRGGAGGHDERRAGEVAVGGRRRVVPPGLGRGRAHDDELREARERAGESLAQQRALRVRRREGGREAKEAALQQARADAVDEHERERQQVGQGRERRHERHDGGLREEGAADAQRERQPVAVEDHGEEHWNSGPSVDGAHVEGEGRERGLVVERREEGQRVQHYVPGRQQAGAHEHEKPVRARVDGRVGLVGGAHVSRAATASVCRRRRQASRVTPAQLAQLSSLAGAIVTQWCRLDGPT